MTDLEIAYPEIVSLIEAYEKALFNKMQKDPSDSDVRTAYMANFTNMENIVKAHLDTSQMSKMNMINNIINEINVSNDEASKDSNFETQTFALTNTGTNNNTTNNTTNEKEYVYQECSITDEFGKEEDSVFDVEFKSDPNNNLNSRNFLNDSKLNKKYSLKLTNKFEAEYENSLTEYIDDKILNKTLLDRKFSLEDCLNCVIKIELKTIMPSLKIIFDFSKLLNKIKELIQQFFNDMDPTKLLSMICDFFAKLGKNAMCPQNLIGLELLLPTLFAKYTFDLIKLRFDWTALLGPMLKGILTALVTLIENIPRLVNPFIDCLINSITTILKALESLAASTDKIVNQVGDGLNRITNLPLEMAKRFENPQEQLDKINKDILNLDNSLNRDEKFFRNFNVFKGIAEEIDILFKAKKIDIKSFEYDFVGFSKAIFNFIDNQELILPTPLPEYGVKYHRYLIQKTDVELEKELYRYKERTEYWQREKNNRKYFKAGFVAENKDITFPSGFGESSKGKNYNLITDKKLKPLDLKTTTRKKLNERYVPIIDQGRFSKKELEEMKKIADKYDKDQISNHLFSKYGVDVISDYRTNNDWNFAPTINLRGKVQSLFKTVDERFLFYLREIKAWINESVGNVINALKALDQFINELFDGEFKLLGNIQEILHLIRFVRLIVYLLQNGLDSCDEIRKNKDVFKNLLKNSARNPVDGSFVYNSSGLTFLDDNEVDNMGYNSDDVIVAVSKDGNYQTIVDLTDCSDVSNHLNVNDTTLDALYEGMKNV